MDIGSGGKYPSNALSNFSPYEFEIDGVTCASMEGFLQSLKFDKPHIQEEVCKLVGKQAKFRGKKRNKAWKQKQVLWWQGKEYPRQSEEYRQLIERAYNALFQNAKFRNALQAAKDSNSTLTHSIGSNKEKDTTLTEREFIRNLNRLMTYL